MSLNTIQSAKGTAHVGHRIGRGIDSGLGKTGGYGHKDRKNRIGGFHKVDFESGQIPLQYRLPKRGFKSLTAVTSVEVRLSELNLIAVNEIDILAFKQVGLIPATISNVKVIVSSKVSKAVTSGGVKATEGTKATIEVAGGKVGE